MEYKREDMKIGDGIVAVIVDKGYAIRGTYIKDNKDGTIQVKDPVSGKAFRCFKDLPKE